MIGICFRQPLDKALETENDPDGSPLCERVDSHDSGHRALANATLHGAAAHIQVSPRLTFARDSSERENGTRLRHYGYTNLAGGAHS